MGLGNWSGLDFLGVQLFGGALHSCKPPLIYALGGNSINVTPSQVGLGLCFDGGGAACKAERVSP